MDFTESQDVLDFKAHVDGVLKDKVRPPLREWSKEKTTPPQMYGILGEAGLLGFMLEGDEVVAIPWQKNIHYYKKVGALSGGVSIASFANSQLTLQALQFFGNDEQKRKYLVPGVKGETINAFANTEPGAGSDAGGISIRAEDRGDHFLVNGTKTYITNGDIADTIIFTAVTHPDAEKKHARISMLVTDGDVEGLERRRLKKFGWAESHLSTLIFKDVKVPRENLVGEPKRGFYQTMKVFNNSRIGLAALAFGHALGAFRMAYRHANRREIFGRRIIDMESKRNEFAHNLAFLEATWLLVEKAAWLADTGREFRYNSSMAKLFSTEEGLKIAMWASETFGGSGVLETNQMSQYPLDLKAALMGEGAPEIQKKIIAGNLDELLNGLK